MPDDGPAMPSMDDLMADLAKLEAGGASGGVSDPSMGFGGGAPPVPNPSMGLTGMDFNQMGSGGMPPTY